MLLSWYKAWVKRHPSIVQNLDWLLLFTVWNPSRTNGGYEFTYEAYHAALGLLSLWHQHVIDEGELPTARPTPYLWLDALEYLETLIELRGMHLESQGKMSRYGPLIVVEMAKAILKMAAWSRYSAHMFLRRPTPDDLHQFESELGLQDILASLERLHCKYTTLAPEQPQTPPPGEDRLLAQAPHRQSVPGDCAAGCAGETNSSAPPSGLVPLSAAAGAAAAGPLAECGAGCCSTAAPAAGASGIGEPYGFRQYVGEQLGHWAGALLPMQLVQGAGVGGGCGGGGSCRTARKDTDARSSGTSAQQGDCHAASGGGCSTSMGTGASSSATVAAACTTTAAVATGSARAGSSSGAQGPVCGSAAARQSASMLNTGCPAGAGSPVGLEHLHQHYNQQQQREEVAGRSEEDPDAHMGRNLLWLSELLHIWRPVVYVTLLKRYGRRSWRPWAASLAVDLLSGHFHRRGRQHLATAAARAADAAAAGGVKGDAHSAPPPPPPRPYGVGTSLLSVALARSLAAPGITAGEERELYDRRRKLLLYALRSPFLESTTLSWLATLRDATRHLPLVGFGADYLHSLVETFTAYYCYTSGSN